MLININSEAFCLKAYLNYHCYGNTMNLTAEEMGLITQAWKDRIPSWQATVSSDENEYEFDDSEYANYKTEGRNAAQKTVGYKKSQGGDIAAVAGHGVTAIGGAIFSNIAGKVFAEEAAKQAAKNLAKKAAEEATKEAAKELGVEVSKEIVKEAGKEAAKQAGKEATKETVKQAAEKAATKAASEAATKAASEAAKEGGKEITKEAAAEAAKQGGEAVAGKVTEEAATEAVKDAGKSIGCIIGCVVGAATAAAYWIKQPNKEEKEACDKLQTEMTGAQATLADTQGEMQTMSDEIINLSDEANMLNEDTNEEIEEQKTEYDMYYETYLAIQEKIDAGEPLTESEKELYKEVIGYLSETGVLIEELSEDTTDEVSDLYDEIGTYQDGYDVAAESMGQIEGMTDYAASFDETTQTMCYVEGIAQTINAASSAKSAYEAFALATSGSWAFGATAWAYAFGVMGAAAAVSSGIGAGQQFTWAGQVGTEIEMRKATQDLNTDTMDMYTEEIDAYDGMMQGVEDLELEIPDEIEAPEEVSELPTENPTGTEAVPEELKPKKPEEE